jgi:uncharacterized membrane protein
MKILEMQKVPASHGLLWIRHGITLIMRSPLQAISLSMVFALGIFMALLVPMVGVFLAILLMPLMMAGYMRVCRSLEYSEKVEPRLIFAGFNIRTTQLATLGGILLMGIILISMFTAAVGGTELSGLLQNFQQHQDTAKFINALLAPESGLRLTMLMGFALFFVLMLAMQFAPMLVFFNQLSPKDALLVSLRSSVRNILPFSVYSLLIQLIAFFLSVVPYELGLLVLLPLGMTSMYVAYRDIFNEKDSTEPDKVESTARSEE